MELSVLRAQTETRKEERRRAEKEKQDLKTNSEAEITELREAVKKLQELGVGGGGSFLHHLTDDDVENLRLRVDELTNENRQLRVQQIQRDANETLLKSEITQLKLDLDEKEFEASRQKETHEAYVAEQEALFREMGVLKSVNRRLLDKNDELRETLVASPMLHHRTPLGQQQPHSASHTPQQLLTPREIVRSRSFTGNSTDSNEDLRAKAGSIQDEIEDAESLQQPGFHRASPLRRSKLTSYQPHRGGGLHPVRDEEESGSPLHYGTKPGHFETSIIHFPTSEGVSEVSEQAKESAQRRARAKRAVRSKRTSERCEQTDERVAQYLRLDSCLFQTTVR